MDSTWDKPVLAIVLRGIDANKKIETILGHFNPEMARRTH
jgi:nucleoside diphosphate kinase